MTTQTNEQTNGWQTQKEKQIRRNGITCGSNKKHMLIIIFATVAKSVSLALVCKLTHRANGGRSLLTPTGEDAMDENGREGEGVGGLRRG